MEIQDIQNICQSFPLVENEIKWRSDLVFMIARKMFCMIDLEPLPTRVCFKVPEEDFEELCALPYFRPAPYFGQHKWVQFMDIEKMNKSDWEYYLKQSYELVKAKLPLRIRKELDANAIL